MTGYGFFLSQQLLQVWPRSFGILGCTREFLPRVNSHAIVIIFVGTRADGEELKSKRVEIENRWRTLS